MFRQFATLDQTTLNILDCVLQSKNPDQKVYLVGGVVRDILLKRPIHDLDFTMTGNVRSLARKIADRMQGGFYMLDDERNTARVVLESGESTSFIIDFASFRGETLMDDLKARDFTINAIAIDIEAASTLIDPLGGAKDILKKQLAVCSQSSFSDDPIRILRAVRQSLAFKFRLSTETLKTLRESIPLLTRPSIERIRDELLRMLGAPYASSAIRMLDHLGILPTIMPELLDLKSIQQSPPHIYDVWQHTLAVTSELEKLIAVLGNEGQSESAENLTLGLAVVQLGRFRQQIAQYLNTTITSDRSQRSLIFWSALYHDSGKPQSCQIENGRTRFIGHELVGTEIIEKKSKAFALSGDEINYAKLIVQHHMRIHLLAASNTPITRRIIYRFFRDTGSAGVAICLLSLADSLATFGTTLPQERWASELQITRQLLEAWWEQQNEVVSPVKLLDGNDLINLFNLKPGPGIGQLLESLREAQASDEIKTRQEAVDFIQSRLSGGGTNA